MEIVLRLSNSTEQQKHQHLHHPTTSLVSSSTVSSSSIGVSNHSVEDCFTVNDTNTSSITQDDYLNELIREKFNDATVIISVVVLVLINVVVIAGNILVILSVFTSTKLRTVTNFFIVSLAVADFLVGIAVLPYSLTLEILDTWIFGEIWCQGWLVIDVWMCTASILNLVAISVDRYLAVTQPVRYRSLMTAKRAKYIIAAVWILSFIICFPPLVVRTKDLTSFTSRNSNPYSRGQSSSTPTYRISSLELEPNLHPSSPQYLRKSTGENTGVSLSQVNLSSNRSNLVSELDILRQSISDLVALPLQSKPFPKQWQLTSNHSRVSLFPVSTSPIPANPLLSPTHHFISTLNLNSNSAQSPSTDPNSLLHLNFTHEFSPNSNFSVNLNPNSSHNPVPTLETTQHWSRTKKACTPHPVQCALFTEKSYVIYSAFGSFFIPMFVMIFFYWRIYLVAIRTTRALKRGYRTTKTTGDGTNEERLTLRIHRGYGTEEPQSEKHTSSISTESNLPSAQSSGTNQPTSQQKSTEGHHTRFRSRIPITIYRQTSKQSKSSLTVNNLSIPAAVKCAVKRSTLSPGDIVEMNGQNRRNSPGCQSTLSLPSSSSPSSSREGSAKSNKVVLARLSKRTSKYQAKRFHAETKAAKTVGIIVGGFIVCWLPFFTFYLMRAFCDDCISEQLFSIFFWLGYCNSMINPCIYGLFSRDFRRAFKNIICRCKFREETSVSSLIRQIHMPTFFEDMPEDAKHESQDY